VERGHQVLESLLAPQPIGEGDDDTEPCRLQFVGGVVLVEIVVCLVQSETLLTVCSAGQSEQIPILIYTTKVFENPHFGPENEKKTKNVTKVLGIFGPMRSQTERVIGFALCGARPLAT